MTISAAMVKELRDRTGSGMMECKKALTESGGDIEAAIELMRKAGLAKADKRAGRTAAEGLVAIRISGDGRQGVIAEVNSETDFVARGDDFVAFAGDVANAALEAGLDDVAAVMGRATTGGTFEERRQAMVARIGENIGVRRITRIASTAGRLCSYVHGTRIGVLVEIEGGNDALGRDVAMHIAASSPVCVGEQDVPAELLAKEREIYAEQASSSGKPENIIAKMVEGRVRKFIEEVTLLGQPFVKDPDTSVGKLLQGAGATVRRFVRFEVGEGIQRRTENFAEEVMAQVRGA